LKVDYLSFAVSTAAVGTGDDPWEKIEHGRGM
jgi:hypothetical protein